VFATVLTAWRAASIDAIKDFEEAKEIERLSRGEIDRSEMMPAKDEIPRILGAVRAKSYPFVSALIDLLPSTNHIRKQAEEKLDLGKKLLVGEYQIRSSEIGEHTWMKPTL
jgi:hypothetical protein